jgi:glucokinase
MSESWLVGIEIGGTKLQLGLGRGDGSLRAIERNRVEPALGASAILDQIRVGYRALLERSDLSPADIKGVGVGFGGPVDVAAGCVQTSYQVPGWTGFPLVGWLKENLGVPAAVLQNDADTAGLAEVRFGAGVGCSPLLYLTIGSGIGGALIIDGQIYRGAGRGAAEIGHLEVPDASAPDSAFRQLEEISSGWGIARQARELAEPMLRQGRAGWVVLARANGNPRAITAEMVAEAAAQGDEPAEEVLDWSRRALAYALRQAIVLLAPSRIILGGGVSLIGHELWFEPIRRLVDATVFAPFLGSYDIVPASLGEEVVVHGALVLAHTAAGVGS